MFNPSRDQVREFFIETWRKHRANDVLTPLEAMALDWIDRALQRFQPKGGRVVARQLTVPAGDAPLRFARLLDALGPLGRYPEDGQGVFVTCFGTAGAASPPSREGRLYTLFFGRDAAHIDALIARVEDVLAGLRPARGPAR